MHRPIRLLPPALAACALLLAAGCRNPNSAEIPEDVRGAYTLVSINGQSLPIVVGSRTLVSGTFSVSNTECLWIDNYQDGGTATLQGSPCTYDGGVLSWTDLQKRTAVVTGTTITLNDGPNKRLYTRKS